MKIILIVWLIISSILILFGRVSVYGVHPDNIIEKTIISLALMLLPSILIGIAINLILYLNKKKLNKSTNIILLI